jgi:exopolysaccharide biosynthesis polyprenyl glycosylphosphotransferase
VQAKRGTPGREPDDVRVVPDAEDPQVIDLTHEAVEAEPGASRHYRRLGWLLVGLDVLCLLVALFTAFALRFGETPDVGYLRGMVAACVLWVLVFHSFGLYATQHLSGLEEFRRTLSAVGVGMVLVILLAFWTRTYVSRSWMALTLLIVLALELTGRRIVRARERRLAADDSLVLRTLIIGRGADANEAMEALDVRGSGFLPVGFINVDSPSIASEGVSTAERVDHVRAVLRRHRADCVLVASPNIGRMQVVAVMQAARQEGVVVRIYTHLSGVWASRMTVQRVGQDGVVLTMRPATLTRTQRFVKRGMDLALSAIALILFSPLLLIAALLIKLTSRGPVLFRQERVTEGGRTFTMYKLRTMNGDGSEEAGDTSVPFFKHHSEDRVTGVGRWLRRWSIDELPQLFNVLIGDMSLVGPRPLPAEQVEANPELLGPRHEVRSGITGWWQIHGRADLDVDEAIVMDHFYIENWSPGLDVYILFRTVGALLTRKGAY